MIIQLFSKNIKREPSAILQCKMSGEYLSYNFMDWRHAVHYLRWCNKYDLKVENITAYNKWSKKYGYDSEESDFYGDLNEYDEEDGDVICTKCGTILPLTDLYNVSAWTMEEDEEDEEDDDD